MNPAYGYTLAALIGAAGSWYVQGLRWDSDVADIRHNADVAVSANVDAVNQQLIASRAQTEAIRATFIDYKAGKENETSAFERAVADGTKRLSIRATCPSAMHTDGTVSGGASSGAAELDPASRPDYFLLKKGLDRQFAELQFCRSELKKRSAKPN
jgi:hypothetical protein